MTDQAYGTSAVLLLCSAFNNMDHIVGLQERAEAAAEAYRREILQAAPNRYPPALTSLLYRCYADVTWRHANQEEREHLKVYWPG